MTDWIAKGKEYIDNHPYAWIVESVEIQNPVTVIPEKAFSNCANLREITIPGSVRSIGNEAFLRRNLSSVTMQGTTPPTLGTDVFTGCLFVNRGSQGIHIPSCQYLNAYLNTEGWDAYRNNIDAPHTLNYTDSGAVITQTCSSCSLSATATLSTDNAEYTYTGNAIMPVKITCSTNWVGKEPASILYTDNTNVGTATALLTIGTGADAAIAKLSFTIQPKTFTSAVITLSASSFPHTGNPITPTVAVKDGSTTLTEGTDYTVSYTDNTNVGTAAVTVTGMGNYSGTIRKTFEIVKSDAEKVAAAKTVVEAAIAGITATNSTTKQEIQNEINKALQEAGIGSDVTVTVGNFGMASATTSVTGSVAGMVTITSGSALENVTFNKSIPRLPKTDAEKVADAEQVVDQVLSNLTATNATTEAEILGVINTALGNAGITGVTVIIEHFRKQEATTTARGGIAGDVLINCGGVIKTVKMDKPIAQLTAGKYMVAVNNGTGGGEYAEGSTVTITADAPVSGKQFDRWVVNSGSVTLAGSTSSTTTFTMPAEAVSVTATYKDKPGGGNQGGGSGGDNTGGDNQGGGNSGGSGGNSGGGNQGGGSDGNNQNGSNRGNGGAGSTSGTAAPAPAGQPRVKQEKEGNIQKEVKVTGENTLDASMTAPVSELADTVLTQTEKQQAAEGTAIRIVLDIKDASAFVSAADKAAVEAAFGSSTAVSANDKM